MFAGQIEARPEALAGFLRDAEGIAADLRDRPVGADEMQRARLPLVERAAARPRRQCLVARRPRSIQTNPQSPRRSRASSPITAITPAELQQAARRFLVPGRAWKLVIVPETAAAPANPPH